MKSLRFESKSLSRFHKENSSFKFNSYYAIQKILRKILNKIVHYLFLPHFPPENFLCVCVCVYTVYDAIISSHPTEYGYIYFSQCSTLSRV